MKPLLLACLLIGLLTSSRSAYAEDQSVVSAARELAVQGFRAYHEGRYAEAAEKSLRAYQMVRVPTLAVNRARALAKLGKLVQSFELYLEAIALRPLDEPWLEVQYEAQANAERERDELLARMPRLRLIVEGADVAQVAITLDGRSIPRTHWTVEQFVDPGEHSVIARRGAEEVRATIWAKEAEHLPVKLVFGATQSHAFERDLSRSPTTPSPTTPSPTTPSPTKDAPKGIHTKTLLGWSGIALGGVGIVFGTLEGLSAQSKRNALAASGNCPDRRQCDPSVSEEVDSLMARRTLSTIGFLAGGIIGATGITLLLWPSKRDAQSAVALAIGPNFVAIQGGLE